MLRKIKGVDIVDLGLEEWMHPLGPYLFTDVVGMGITFVPLMLSLRKGRYVGKLQWDSTRKAQTAWEPFIGQGNWEWETKFTSGTERSSPEPRVLHEGHGLGSS